MQLRSDISASFLTPGPQPEYDGRERRLLCQLAHEAIVAKLENRELASFTPSEHLSELRGVFTTLYLEGRLRGCVGYPTAFLPLQRAVSETARAAAFEDPRFPPVTLVEARRLRVSLSVLSCLKPLLAEEVEVGRHGLLISQGARRGLLLPQVPVEHGWDRGTFLEQTCRKAGLPLEAWRHGATIEGFTAEIFGDDDSSAVVS
jgi:AmmeMemoRadiSam system protein A